MAVSLSISDMKTKYFLSDYVFSFYDSSLYFICLLLCKNFDKIRVCVMCWVRRAKKIWRYQGPINLELMMAMI